LNKLGIWALVIAAAFFVGILSANPVVEAAGGWKAAIEDLQSQIDAIPSDPPFDPSGLQSQIDSNDVELADHETRITELEGNSIYTKTKVVIPTGSQSEYKDTCDLGDTVITGYMTDVEGLMNDGLQTTPGHAFKLLSGQQGWIMDYLSSTQSTFEGVIVCADTSP